MVAILHRYALTDRSAASLCPAHWLDEVDDVWWNDRFELLLALLAPPGERRLRRAG